MLRPARCLAARLPLAHDRRHPALLRRRARAVSTRTAGRARPSGAFLDEGGYGNGFRNHFLVPVVSAVWSTSAAEIMDFPVDYLLRFLDNHGLIGFGKGKPWRTVVGGSMIYVERIIERLPAGLGPCRRPGRRRPARRGRASRGHDGERRQRAVRRASSWPRTRTWRWRLLDDADAEERSALWAASTTPPTRSSSTRTSAMLPRRARARGSWNVDTADCRRPGEQLTMTY